MDENEKLLWERVCRGELDIDSPEVVAAAKDSHFIAMEVQRFQQVQEQLNLAGAEMQEVLREARSAPVLDSDRKLLGPSLGGAGKARAGKWSRIAGVAALLIAALGVAWFQGLIGSNPKGPGPALGSQSQLQLITPTQDGHAFDRFAWRGVSKFGAWYVVHVIDLDSGNEFTSPRLQESPWVPADPLTAKHIRWYVVLHEASADPVTSATAEVRS
ncbi:MAG: hypothetical protein R3E96_07075 [Planctomycetota bacterium]